MPIELMTGLPGTSKTTRLVARMLQESRKKNPRPMVAMGVNGLKPGLAMILDDPTRWAEITDRTEGPCTCPLIGGEPNVPKADGSLGFQPHTHRIPHGSLVFVDEAWKWFGHLQDASRQATPKHVLQLAEHRHMGIDFVWTTQTPAQIFPFARGQIGTHTHIVRKFGTSFCDTYTWGELQEDVKSDGKRSMALKATDTIPSEAWEWFLSSQEHTIKRNIPWRVVAIPGILIGAVVCAWLAYTNLRPAAMAAKVTGQGPESAIADPAHASPLIAQRGSKATPLTPEEYTTLHLPRFATMPHTAPVFDGRAPTADPQLFCMASFPGEDGDGTRSDELTCTCVTEQGTKYEIPDGHCMRVARWGAPYNPYKERRQDQPQQSQDAQGGRARASGAPLLAGAGEGGPGAQPAAYGGMRSTGW